MTHTTPVIMSEMMQKIMPVKASPPLVSRDATELIQAGVAENTLRAMSVPPPIVLPLPVALPCPPPVPRCVGAETNSLA